MKILGSYSVSSVLQRVLDVVWVIWVVAAAGGVVAFIVQIALPDPVFVPVALDGMLVNPEGFSLIKGPAGVTVEVLEARVAFASSPRHLAVLGLVYFLLLAALGTGVLFHLRKVLASLKEGQLFIRENARRLHAIAWLSLGGVLVTEAWRVFGYYHLKAAVQFASGRVTFPFPAIHDLFFALVLFVIAGAARIGVTLEEERALTV
jgi:hypothetical protein